MRHHTKDKGDLGLVSVVADLMRHGIQVALPISEHLPFDCIGISPQGALVRISVKYREVKAGRVEVRLRSSWADRNGSHNKNHSPTDYDVTAIYCPDSGACYYVVNSEVNASNTLVLRVDRARNNQAKYVKLAGNFRDPRRIFKSPGSSGGQSKSLLSSRSGVRVPPGVPTS